MTVRKKISILVLAVFAFVLASSFVTASAAGYYQTNPNTGYEAFVYDDEELDLLTDDEEQRLVNELYEITQYGNMFIYTTYAQTSDYEGWADSAYTGQYGSYANGVIFQIDMKNRKLTINGYGDLQNTITSGKASSITDNVYTYASNEDYYTCLSKAFSQIKTLLEGGRIAEPMRYVSAAILAVVIGVLINYFILRATSSTSAASDRKILDSLRNRRENLVNPQAIFTHETKVYNPRSSGSGHGGGGGHHGGGGGGHSSGSHGF